MLGLKLGLARQGDDPAFIRLLDRNLGAEPCKHPLGVVTGGLCLDHDGLARSVQPGQKHGGFHLRRRHRHRVAHRKRVPRTDERHGQTPAAASVGLAAELGKRVRHPRHRPAVQARIAGKGRCDRRGCHRPHDQAHAGPGIPAVDHLRRLGKAANADTMHRPAPAAVFRHLGPEGAHGLGRVQHVLPFKQAFDRGLANAHRAEDQGAMRDRLVARHLCRACQRPASRRYHWNRFTVTRHVSALIPFRSLLAHPSGSVHARHVPWPVFWTGGIALRLQPCRRKVR